MLPDDFINRIAGQKYLNPEALLNALDEPSPVSIRVNPAKWDKKPLNDGSVPWCKTGYYLSDRPSYTLDPIFHSGCYYPQEASSMFLEEVLRQTEGLPERIKVLDLCGAPGGKSTHLSQLIGEKNLLVANEVIRQRAAVLSETLTKWGSSNALVTQNDPALFGRLPGFFDVILVDAPCSGEGMFRNSVAINEWSAENTAHCSVRQKRILMDVWPALKQDGILIYSTCTFNPGENEENIKWLTDKQEAECVRINISDFAGITEIDYQGIFGYGFYPGKTRGEGFFISVLRKTGSQETKPFRSQKISELKPGKTDLEVAGRWSDFPKERLLKWGDELFAVPCEMDDYLQLFQNLKIVKTGTRICNVKKNNYLPSHELALSQKLRKDAFPHSEVDLQGAVSYLRRDNFVLQNAAPGWNILTFNGINIGFVNNIGNRVNNYFPMEWRIRLDASSLSKALFLGWQ
jgi:16S rRNA C967 or C1407 C5-methylase (RsmB/RsmF family)/NOL1/NOP2/fmu family ribosome biogenesis protein